MVIFINGSINSGKSTIAKILASKIKNTAILEIDFLRDFINFIPLEKSININLENACLLIKNFVKHKINVVVPYPISEKNYLFLKKMLKNLKTEIYFYTLNPKLSLVLKNRGKRKLNNWEKERIKYHYKIKINKPSFGKIIDNSFEKPEETVKKILKDIIL